MDAKLAITISLGSDSVYSKATIFVKSVNLFTYFFTWFYTVTVNQQFYIYIYINLVAIL